MGPAVFPCLRVVAVVVLALLVASGLGPDAFGQSRTAAALLGRATGAGGTLAGATIRIASAALIGGARAAATDTQGRFRFAELPPGLYEVTAEASGYETVRMEGVRLSVGMSTEVSLELRLHAGDETVVVRAEGPPIDPTASAMPVILSHDLLRNIPTDRESAHVLDLAPAVNMGSAYGGSEESGNAYEMDGVSISDPQGGAPWSPFNYSLIDEVQLVGLGAPAEYGQFTGVVFNTVTRSGGNEFSGSGELFYSGKGLTASSPDTSDVTALIDEQTEASLLAGGPIRKDRLWAFGALQYLRNGQSEGGPMETTRDARAFFKLTWRATPKNTVQAWVQWDRTRIRGRNGDAFTPLSATTGEDNPELVGNLSFKSALTPSSVLSVVWGGYSGHHHFDPESGFATPGRVDAQTGLASENAAQFGIVDRRYQQVSASLAHHAKGGIGGDHELKLGVELERSVVRDRYGYPGGAFFSDNEGPALDPQTLETGLFTLAFLGGGYDARGTNERLSIFAQDSWRIGSRLTLNPGLRLDVNRGRVAGATVFRTQPLAPRIGLAWRPGGDERFVVRAHYGRYYEALYSSFYYYLGPGVFSPLTALRIFNSSGYTDTVTTNPGQRYAMDPQIRQPRLDQYVLGFDRQLPHDIVLGATLVYRRNRDLIETVSRDGQFVEVPGQVPGTGQTVTLFDQANAGNDVLIYTNPPVLGRDYRAAIVSATRPLRGNWQMKASYVYSRARGNTDNLGFDELGTGGNTPFFEGRFLDTPNSLVNAHGRLTHDQTHEVKLQGTWIVPHLHLAVSPSYTFHSGDTWGPRGDCLLTDDGNHVLRDGLLGCHEFPQGPVRYFAEPRGRRRLRARSELDLRVAWQHDLGGRRQLSLTVDAFNLTNQVRATQVETWEGEALGQPTTVSFPRHVRFGIRVDW